MRIALSGGFRSLCSILLGVIFLLGNSCTTALQTTPTPTTPPASLTPTQTPASTPTRLPTATATHTESPTPVPSICSPLAIQPLDKLSDIITQPFIMPRVMDDGTYTDNAHHGVDLGFYTRNGQKFTGTPVLAALDGKIAAIIHDRPPYGNMIMLETPFEHIPAKIIASQKIPVGDSLYLLYAHLQNLQPLEISQVVKCGQQLAETGLTGFTGGPHLHFETRWGPANASFPVMGFYRADMTPDEMKNYKTWRMSGTFQLFDPLQLLTP